MFAKLSALALAAAAVVSFSQAQAHVAGAAPTTPAPVCGPNFEPVYDLALGGYVCAPITQSPPWVGGGSPQ